MTILLTSTIWSQAQQINAVPDYVFRNQMSVGRNAVTDTAAYFSIGPRYGATKGFMPPIVVDTAIFSSGKRNGLLIFSVQKNKFLYWDSVRVQWSDMAGGSGSYILAGDTSAMLAPYLRKSDTTSMLTAYLRKGDTTAMLSPYYRSATASAALALKLNISDTSSMLANYIRHAGYGLTKSGQSFLVDTLNIATRAWRQKGLDSLAALEVSGSGTTNYVAKFTAGSTIGNSQIFDNGTNVGIGTGSASPVTKFHISQSNAGNYASVILLSNSADAAADRTGIYGSPSPGAAAPYRGGITFHPGASGAMSFHTGNNNSPADGVRMYIQSNGRIGINTTTDAGYQLNVNGTFNSGANYSYFGGDANTAIYMGSFSNEGRIGVGGRTSFPTAAMTFYTADGTNNFERMRISSAGDVGINQASPSYKLDINGTLRSVNGANFATTSGNVGIGTETPLYKLDVRGAARSLNEMRVTSGSYLTNYNTSLRSDVSANGILQLGNNNINYILAGNTLAGGFLAIRVNVSDETLTSGSEAMRITSSGELLVNTTSDAGDYKLQVSGNIYNTGSAVLAATSGNVGVGTSTPTATASKAINIFGASAELHFTNSASGTTGTDGLTLLYSASDAYFFNYESGFISFGTANTERGRINSAGEWIIDASGTDAGDYKLQVVGNARIGTGKLDIASNTTFGLGVARSGTSEVAGQIYNSNGILYLGAESSAGGQIFSGSSAYAAVIGSGAAYPLQFAANNITRATLTTNGNFMIGFPTDTYFYRLQVNGSIFSNNQIIAQNAAAQLNIDSSTNISPLYISNQSLTGSSAQGIFYGSTTWNTTGNPSLIDLAITNTASGSDANYIKISDGSNIFRVTKAAEVVTAAPTGGSIRKWKLGEAATVSPTSPNRTIRVEIDGTVYYLHAKTTND